MTRVDNRHTAGGLLALLGASTFLAHPSGRFVIHGDTLEEPHDLPKKKPKISPADKEALKKAQAKRERRRQRNLEVEARKQT